MNRPIGVVTKAGSFVRSNVLDQYALKNEEGESRQIKDPFRGQYREKGLVEPLYDPTSLTSLLGLNTYHMRASKTKARDTAGLGWELIGHGEKPSEASKKKLEEFFHRLNPPIEMMLDRCGVDFEVVGYATLEVLRKNYDPKGEPIRLTHAPSHTMRVHKDENKFAQIRATRTRWFKRFGYERDVDKDTGAEHPLGGLPVERRASEILWWTNYTPSDDYYGASDIIPAIGAITGDVARRDYNIAFFNNFGVPAYAVFITGDFNPGEEDADGKTELEKLIESHFQELSRNPHSTLFLSIPSNNGENVQIKFEKLATDVKEASFRLYREDNRNEVLAAHAVPPYRAAIAEVGSLGVSVAKETTEIYKRSVIEPRQNTLETLITFYIIRLGFGIEDWRFKLAEVDTTDERHEMDLLKDLFAMGAISAREIRRIWAERFGLDPESEIPADAEPENTELAAAMRSFRDELLGLATKDLALNGHRNGAPARR